MPLDERGKIAAAQIAFYAPIAGLTLYLVFRYALRRDAGWLFLSLFSFSMFDVHFILISSNPLSSKNCRRRCPACGPITDAR